MEGAFCKNKVLIRLQVENAQAFTWLSQLRHRWDEHETDCFANICDAQFRYSHEYLGNTPRLVITPLTDRCILFPFTLDSVVMLLTAVLIHFWGQFFNALESIVE